MSKFVTSADIEDGKVEYDPKTGVKVEYTLIEGGYKVSTTTPQPNGTIATQVQTFWDPKPVSEEDMKKEQENRKLVAKRMGKEIRIDSNTTMLTRAIDGGYEEVYTTVNADGTKSSRTKTFFDSVPADELDKLKANMDKNAKKVNNTKINTNTNTRASTNTNNTEISNTNTNKNVSTNADSKSRRSIMRNASTESTESMETRHVSNQKKSVLKSIKDNHLNYSEESLVEESHRVSQNIEITENNRTVRKNSMQEQSIKAISQINTSGSNTDGKKKRKPKSSAPPPPADFPQNDTTTVTSNRVTGGTEYTYSTKLESGTTVTVSKCVYEEEETELTEEEVQAYQKTLKDAEKHKNITQPKRLKSESGTKKVVPSEKDGEVTTVETIKFEGATQYHYTTVTSEGIVKKTTKTVYDAISSVGGEDSEEEIVEEIEEEIIEPSDSNTKVAGSMQKLPKKFSEEVTITSEKKEKKTKKSIISSY